MIASASDDCKPPLFTHLLPLPSLSLSLSLCSGTVRLWGTKEEMKRQQEQQKVAQSEQQLHGDGGEEVSSVCSFCLTCVTGVCNTAGY